MNDMETGYIKIKIEESKTPSVEIRLINNELWLTKYEIAELLKCFPQRIEANLRSIFESQLLLEKDCTYNHRYTDKGIEKQCLYYNMEVLIFISYRINTYEAKVFREFVNSALREHLHKDKMPKESIKFVWMFRSQQNYMLN
jgi:hypothetical protein